MGQNGKKASKSACCSVFLLGEFLSNKGEIPPIQKFFYFFLFFRLTCYFLFVIIKTSKTKKGQQMEIYNIIYKKFFNHKEQAEQFIEKHKKQDCFHLSFQYFPCGWIVTKSQKANKQ